MSNNEFIIITLGRKLVNNLIQYRFHGFYVFMLLQLDKKSE